MGNNANRARFASPVRGSCPSSAARRMLVGSKSRQDKHRVRERGDKDLNCAGRVNSVVIF